jgi:hypothetical protein
LEPTTTSTAQPSFQASSSSTWQPSSSSSSGTSYWTNQIAPAPLSPAIQNISPTRSSGSPQNYIGASSSPGSITYHHLTPSTHQNYQTPAEIYHHHHHHQSSCSSPNYISNPPTAPIVPMPQNHQLYYPTSISPSSTTHQIYGNVINPSGFSNFGYSSTGWPHAAAAAAVAASDYGLFQGTYHYQAAEYIPLINDSNYTQSAIENKIPTNDSIYPQSSSTTCNIIQDACDKSPDAENNNNNNNNKDSWHQQMLDNSCTKTCASSSSPPIVSS